MPPKAKTSRDDILRAARDIVREKGADALNARALAERLEISTQPIFSHYASMDALRAEVIASANQMYQGYLQKDMSFGQYPPYKASGMAYIRFAREESNLFKLLFMRDRSQEIVSDGWNEIQPLVRLIQESTGMSEENARLFHIGMWVYVHGIATMIATGYLDWDEDLISRMVTENYLGLKMRFSQKEDAQ